MDISNIDPTTKKGRDNLLETSAVAAAITPILPPPAAAITGTVAAGAASVAVVGEAVSEAGKFLKKLF
ncbi:hypothetical protein NIES2101_13075 [Calothrix sp. HK-06]|nr:hypothetical protein NIES2101_13075 [Calothrix sp. HK-06]